MHFKTNHQTNNIKLSNNMQQTSNQPTYYPLEINGTNYLICKLPDQPFSTLHDPETKQIVGQWNNDEASYEITDHAAQFEMINRDLLSSSAAQPAAQSAQPTNTITDEQFEKHMQQLISSGAAFTFC